MTLEEMSNVDLLKAYRESFYSGHDLERIEIEEEMLERMRKNS